MSAQCYMFRVGVAYSITVGTKAIFSSKIKIYIYKIYMHPLYQDLKSEVNAKVP